MVKKNIIIGTAGHVDHGKTCLIQALTGIETDRLEEEKKRGITIELGFAWLELPNGGCAGIVDVPGHERFIKNMFAGAGGIDLALLVIAADEGVMPQTIEHLRILTLLGIPRGIIVLTKCDLVDEEWLELVEEDIRESLKNSLMEGAPMAKVSSHTGSGIESLKEAIYQEIPKCRQKPVTENLRIPIDRVFTMPGFGTVATGTIFEGKIADGQEVMIYPKETIAKVRNLQVHTQKVNEAEAGQRVAVNFSGLKKEELSRGDLIGGVKSLKLSYQIDVHLKILEKEGRVVKNNSRLHFYWGAMEILCKVVLMGRESLEPGEDGYAQLRFETPLALKYGDAFVIRFYSPMETIGGGIVINPQAKKHKRKDEKALRTMVILHRGTKEQRLSEGIRLGSYAFKPFDEIKHQFRTENTTLGDDVISIHENLHIHREYFQYFEESLVRILKVYHTDYPIRQGMTREELKSKLLPKVENAIINKLLELIGAADQVKYEKQFIALKNFVPVYTHEQQKLRGNLEKIYYEKNFNPPKIDELDAEIQKNKFFKQIIEAMTLEEKLIRLEPKLYFWNESYVRAMSIFQSLEKEQEVSLGTFRDALGTNRKYALALLEDWDNRGYTKKHGEGRKSDAKMTEFLEGKL